MSIHRRQTFLKAQIVELDRLLDSIGDHPLMSISHRQRKEELEEELKSLREVDDAIPMHEPSMPLTLISRQQAVLAALRSKETEKYPLSKWYLGALYALDNYHNPDRVSQAAQSLRELVEKLPRVVREGGVQGNAPGFAGLRRDMHARLLKDKERYAGAWEGKEIDSPLAETLEKIDRYLEPNRQPTRKEQVQTAIAGIDPMAHQLDRNIREKKREDLYKLWRNLEDFAHHRNLPDAEEFGKCLGELERIIFDLLAPITAQDQQEILSILQRIDRSQSDIERILALIERRGANFAFFFKYVTDTADASWLSILNTSGYFAHPPNAEPIGDGRVNFPFWWPLSYLVSVFDSEPAKALGILEQLPDTDNPQILEGVVDVVLKSNSSNVFHRLAPKMMVFLDYPEWWSDKIAALLKKPYLFENSPDDLASSLLLKIVEFQPDPQSEDKQAYRKKIEKDQEILESDDRKLAYWETWLEPRPRLKQWDYQEIMEKGVRSLAERTPYQVAHILIDATASMIRIQIHWEDLDKVRDEDGSEIWCRRLDKLGHDYNVSREALINTLTFACEQVFEKSPESIVSLNGALRNQRWKIFTRLRHHLYALHPNEQTRPWIREATLAHEDYARWEHYYEFQRMIRCACEHFGAGLLTEEERTQIFDTILSGPSKTGFQERMGEQFTEELFTKRQHRFHRMRLRPFATVLFGKYADYFQQLEAEADEQISDEDYSPVGETEGGLMSRRSPQPPEALASLADEQLLVYINEWQEEHHDEDDWSVEINIEALAEAFQTVFRDAIIPDADRLRFWIENRERIERLIYVRAMISAMQEFVKAKNFDKLSEWLTFCEWVLAHPDREHEEGYGYKLGEESRENPHWHSSRRAVGDFVGACLAEDVDAPVSARGHLAKLLGLLCTQFDWELDEDKPVFLNSSDQLTEAINKTRSRALESLVDFGLWLRRHDSEADVSEVATILEKRFPPETERPLSLPEHAILGQKYGSIFLLDEVWATEHKSDFFPQDDLPAWVEAFENFLRFNHPFEPFLEVLRDDFDFALQHRGDFKERPRSGPVDPLGRHLFIYYLWGVYPLRGETSLLERYYQQTDGEHSYWANLFDYVGRVLHNSGKHLDDALKDKAVRFLKWRLDAGEPTELERFTFWMEAECLEPELRLNAYSRILDVADSKGMGIFDPLKTLGSLLPEHTAKVVECFTKITDSALKYSIYIPWKDQVKSILKAGLESSDESARNNAEHARDNLLRSGRFDFLELDD